MSLIKEWLTIIKTKKNSEELLEKIKQHYPPLLSILFTRKCIFQCAHCLYPKADQEDLDGQNLQRIDQIINAAYKAGIRNIIHIGRILEKKHLPILRKYQKKGMKIHLIDNGSAARLIEQIKEVGLFFDGGIDISLDGDKKTHQLQRGRGSWEIANRGIRELPQVSSQISITATASALNYKDIVKGLVKFKKNHPEIKKIQITTTSQTNYQKQRMTLSAQEMRFLYQEFQKATKNQDLNLSLYLNKDMEAIKDLIVNKKAEPKILSLVWKVNKGKLGYFPQSIIPAEEIALDCNGSHGLPFGFDYHLNEKPERWKLKGDMILKNPDKSYEMMVDKYFEHFGKEKFKEEKKIFKDF
ncbi:MAG: hypothetical protein GF335_00350 [Candidatus Moranbacteria bacterium]|nr:hypothetical protein [Candidatus Moranbacteria bacterium]